MNSLFSSAKFNIIILIDVSRRFLFINILFVFFIAITIVALGTTLPDILGARMVTRAEEHADGALIHISGSIAVNVLIGVGVPWFVAALWHRGHVIDSDLFSNLISLVPHPRTYFAFLQRKCEINKRV